MENIDNQDAYIARCAKTLSTLHRIVDRALAELEEFQIEGELTAPRQKQWDEAFGAKETVISMAVKLTGILIKLIPMERKIMDSVNGSGDKKVQELSENDLEIIKRYLQKVKDAGLEGELELEEKDDA